MLVRLCIRCPRPARPLGQECARCAQRSTVRALARYYRLKAARRCPLCGLPLGTETMVHHAACRAILMARRRGRP